METPNTSKLIRVISQIVYSLMFLGCVSKAHAETVTIDFLSLPGNQGWEYSGSPLEENDVYSVTNYTLTQTTVGSGSNSTATYRVGDIVDSSKPMSLSFTARILNYEDLTGGTTGQGFNFQIQDVASVFRLAMTDSALIVNGQVFDLDTTIYHDYVLDTYPGGDFDLFVDGVLLTSGSGAEYSLENGITFGDTTSHENTDAEITALSFTVTRPDIDVQQSVDNMFPLENEIVEFTIEVSNIGNQMASGVKIIDLLPAEMSIPAGAAAFATTGSYDPATGEWLIGDMDAGISAVLSIPAVVTELQPPACIVNMAFSQFADTLDDANDEARVAIHQIGVERCVDLEVNFGISANSPGSTPSCNLQGRYDGGVNVTNDGPDVARGVILTITQTSGAGPDLRFDDTNCTNTPSSQCNIAEIKVGETLNINVTSDLYLSYNTFSQTISVSATTSDSDYDLSNNYPDAYGTVGAFSTCTLPASGLPDCLGYLCPSGSSGGCFIATAAYGSSLGPNLDSLREFRDSFMMTNRPGRVLVSFYYRHSPPLADFISKHDGLRAMVRFALTPIIHTIEHPIRTSLLLIGLITVYFVRRRRQTQTTDINGLFR